MEQGFSLSEVLVSLVLMTSASLALLKQQWQVSQLFNQIHIRGSALSQLDNASERLQMGDDGVTALAPFKLRYTRKTMSSYARLQSHLRDQDEAQGPQIITLRITWAPPPLSNQASCTIERQLAVSLHA